jgi:hypothetical protein
MRTVIKHAKCGTIAEFKGAWWCSKCKCWCPEIDHEREQNARDEAAEGLKALIPKIIPDKSAWPKQPRSTKHLPSNPREIP